MLAAPALLRRLGTLGLTALIRPIPVAPAIVASDVWWMLGVAVSLFPLMVAGMRISRLERLLLVAAYGVYLTLLLAG